MALIGILLLFLWCNDVHAANKTFGREDGQKSDKMLPVSFPSKADTLAYVDALKHSNFSQWRSLEEVAKRAGGGSCTGALNTSVLTALYLLGLFNLCAASPASCCVPSMDETRRKRDAEDALPPLLNSLTQNLSSLPLERFHDLPQISTPQGGKVPVHISVVEQVRKLWDSNPRLLSNLPCTTATEAVRSSFISLSGVASGIILAYSIAQLNQCYPDHQQEHGDLNKIWFFPIPKQTNAKNDQFIVRSLPPDIPVKGEDERDDHCARAAVQMEDGSCERLLSSSACPYMQWILLNRETGKGDCFPRLCSEGKVFVEYDQLCHDVNEPGFCPENQRLYLTAWGEAVCDCLDGMFYGPDKKCHRIYNQAYCYKGTVLQFHKPSKTLVCKTDHCKKLNDLLPQYELPYVRSEDNSCYQFGSTGPCEESEQYGFNIEELAPSCVGLEEAGLIRSHRSYQYSHMSFPSFPDKDFPHYEVSYVILNGSTWELMMRTVGGRQKRDILKDFIYENHTVIPFIDTREFPNSIKDISNKFQSLQNDVIMKEQTKDDTIKETPLMFYEKIKNVRLSSLKQMNENNFFQKDENNEINTEDMKEESNKHETFQDMIISDDIMEKIKNENGSNFIGADKNVKLGPNTKNNTEVSYENFDINNNSTEISNKNNDKIQNITQISTGNNKEILFKVLSGKSNPCKWEISFYSQMPNSSISFNSTSIDLLSHKNLAHFRTKNENETKKINFEEMHSSEELINRRKDFEVDSLSNNTNNETGNIFLKGNEKTIWNLHDIDNENISSTIDILDDKVDSTSNTIEMPKVVLEKYSLETNLLYITNDTSEPVSVSVINEDLNNTIDTKHIITNIITEVEMTSENSNEENTRKEIRETAIDTKEIETNIITEGEMRREAIGIGHTRNKRIEKIPKIDNNEKKENKNKEKQEQRQQIIKVSQHEISSKEGPKISNTNLQRKANERRSKRRRKRKRRKKKRNKNKIKKKKISSKDNERNDVIGINRFDDDIIEISQGSNSSDNPKSSKSGIRNPFRNQSLPDYLRNRGRRQAGSRKGLKLGPGIINAPLLNQCRPGAKRDYNGHCRPKVIPSARVPPPRKHAKAKYYEPTPPRMKCKEDKRLDSRGVCRTTFSGLG